MNKVAGFLMALLVCAPVHTQNVRTEVMLFGVFHFANPALDMVTTEQIDVLSSENQAYLAQLSRRVCDFEPTVILLEYPPERQDNLEREFREYLVGDLELSAGEHHQLGFRIAEACNVNEIHAIDETSVGWNPGELFDYAAEFAPDTWQELNDEVERVTQFTKNAHAELSFAELLGITNDPAHDRENKDLYLLTNAIGAGSNFLGADATARWWHRNIRMYANMQKYALPGARVIVIAGQGHTAVLKDLLSIDQRLISHDVLPYL